MGYIPRKLEKTIKEHLKTPEIIAVVGPRQSGKTTMIEHILKDLPSTVSLSFDNRDVLELFEQSPDEFITTYIKGTKYLFIDEFHYSKQGGKILKYIFDQYKGEIKILISGSSAVEITVHAIKYLVGRIVVFTMYPFDFEEFLSARDEHYLLLYRAYKKKVQFNPSAQPPDISPVAHKKFLRYFEEYILFGGYPRVVIEKQDVMKKELLNSIYKTHFLHEVHDILGLVDDYKLNRLFKALTLQIGNLVEYQELSRLSEYSHVVLKKYLNFLEKTYILTFLKPFYQNLRTEIVKNPKPYFVDTGLRNSIINDFRKLDERPDKGALLENGLAMQFLKCGYEIHFWRDKKTNEVDFVVGLGEQKKIAVESKSFYKNIKTLSMERFEDVYPKIPTFFSYYDIDHKIKNRQGVYPVYLY